MKAVRVAVYLAFGLLCFGLMAYVNIDIPSEGEEHDGPWPVDEHEWDDHTESEH